MTGKYINPTNKKSGIFILQAQRYEIIILEIEAFLLLNIKHSKKPDYYLLNKKTFRQIYIHQKVSDSIKKALHLFENFVYKDFPLLKIPDIL